MSIYDIEIKNKNNEIVTMEKYRGRVLLIVNTASKCGFTKQFAELEALYEKYQDKGFEIIGFPCSQFQNQEFDNIDETVEFCQLNYGVTFEMMAKIDVNGENQTELYKYLKSAKKGLITGDIKWNFTKFLVDKEGNVVDRFAPQKTPFAIEPQIKKLLTE